MQHHLQDIRHVSFDLWLTLIRSNPAFKPLRNQLFTRFFDVQQPEEKVSAAFRHFDLLFNSINEKMGYNVHHGEMLLVILDNLGKDIRAITPADLEQYYQDMEQLFFNYPPELLERQTSRLFSELHQKEISISLLSNTGFIQGRTLRKLISHLEIEPYFCFQLYSDEMGCSKPSQKAFKQVFREITLTKSIEKQEILHIGDNPVSDEAGARQFGFRSLLLNEDAFLRKLF